MQEGGGTWKPAQPPPKPAKLGQPGRMYSVSLGHRARTYGHPCAGPGGQCCDVVLVKGHINLGKSQGVGISKWEADGEQMGRDGNDEISL